MRLYWTVVRYMLAGYLIGVACSALHVPFIIAIAISVMTGMLMQEIGL